LVQKNATPEEIELLGNAICKSHLFRIAGFADVIDRFIDIQLKGKVNWLKTFALILLIVNGGILTPSELGRNMLRSPDNITKLVDMLVQDGLVKRYRQGKDRRSVQIKVTPSGLSFMTKTLTDVEREGKLVESSMNPVELEKLETLAETLTQQLTERIRNRG
jgi:DNA-binding MarR family transcriptional regulator